MTIRSKRTAALFAAMAALGALGTATALAIDQKTIERRVDQAIALLEDQGLAALCVKAADPSGAFQADEAYVFVLSRDGMLLCHPRPDLIERQAGRRSNVPDMLANTEARPGGAWTRYRWPHPESLELGVKSTYCRRSGALVVCAGGFFDVGLV